MTLCDLLELPRWESLERDIHVRFGMNPGVFDAAGRRITDFVAWANPLCPAVRKVKSGLTHICACANQAVFRKAMEHGPVIEECDAGLCKIAAPIFSDGVFLGVAGGCGVRLHDSRLDLFHVGKVTGLPDQMLQDLAANVPVITQDKARETLESISAWLAEQLPASCRVALQGCVSRAG